MRMAGPRVTPRQFPTNGGGLCQMGWTAAGLLASAARLTTPLIRVAGELRPANWDAALDLVATRVERLRAEHGPDAVAVFGGGGLTNEKAYCSASSPGSRRASRRSTTTAGSACRRRPRPRPGCGRSASTADFLSR
jgi:anaerobic selenocysteine-containing dehydrogenase